MPAAMGKGGPHGDEEELARRLLLLDTAGIGPVTFRRLLERFGSARAAVAASAEALQAAGLPAQSAAALAAPTAAQREAVGQALAWARQPGNHLLAFDDPAYPPLLLELPDPPPLLYLHGDPAALARPQLAMVGSRNPTPGGAQTARDFARHLAAAGLAITSGLALGIDAAAHEGALAASGVTIAVAGTGLDRVYPARHRELAHRIAERGALVSEFPLGSGPRPEHFPRRNRIISGLSLGTLVVEAAVKSGSLITARLAAEQGREVYAIPGSIHNPLARGCHALIRDGAKLVETAEHILEELEGWTRLPPAAAGTDSATDRGKEGGDGLDPDHRRLLELLGHDPVPVDLLVERSGLTAEVVSSILLILELNGEVASVPGGAYSRLGKRS